MKLAAITTILLIFSCFKVIGQNRLVVKLIDSYSFDQINLDHSFNIDKKNYSIDSINHLIIIEKPFGRQLTISSNQYELYQAKIDFKAQPTDTLNIQLTPNEALINKGYTEIWNSKIQSKDTLIFNNTNALERKVISYLNYLSAIDEKCDNGMCHYSNTYRYQIDFVKTDSVYIIEKIIKLQPRDYNCEELDRHLQRLQSIFPQFILTEEVKNLSFQFTIMI